MFPLDTDSSFWVFPYLLGIRPAVVTEPAAVKGILKDIRDESCRKWLFLIPDGSSIPVVIQPSRNSGIARIRLQIHLIDKLHDLRF